MKEKIIISIVCMLLFLTNISFLANANVISTVNDNNPPNPPTVEGPTSGSISDYYIYYITVTDPDPDDLLLKIEIDFGDGTTEICGSCTSQPWESGDTEEVDHSWKKSGTYGVTARVQDEHGVWGEWSEPLQVSMPKSKLTFQNLFQRISNFFTNLYKIV